MSEETFTYYYKNARGPGYGHQPDGFNPDTRESSCKERAIAIGNLLFYGSVGYSAPLTMEQVWKFDLWAANPVQWAKFFVWNYRRRSVNKSLWLFESYTKALADPNQALLIEGDIETMVCKILLEAGITIESLKKEFENECS